MRTAVLIGVVVFVSLILQSALFPLLPVGWAVPDLMLVICVYLGLYIHSPAGALGAFAIGYLQDSFSGSLIGLNAFAMSVVFVAVYLTSRRLWVDNAISKLLLVFLASLVKTAAVVALVALFVSVNGLWQTVVRYVLFEAGLAALLSLPLFALLARTHQIVPDS